MDNHLRKRLNEAEQLLDNATSMGQKMGTPGAVFMAGMLIAEGLHDIAAAIRETKGAREGSQKECLVPDLPEHKTHKGFPG